jgi:cytosine/adenosine deaminase-related metal-dependent hydrolase
MPFPDIATSSSLKLTGGWLAIDSETAVRGDIEIENGRITRVVPSTRATTANGCINVNLDGYLVLPGLINAHDHLEFNLFPKLGNGPYPNSEAWARDIHDPNRPLLREHLSIPKTVRFWWGGIKNLLSGVTTVCHHNPYEPDVFGKEFPIRVLRQYGWAHSLAFEKDIRGRLAETPDGAPFIVHLGEGTDEQSKSEIFVLDQMGALGSRTVIVHGVALTPDGHALRRRRGAALVWCPTSNRFTLGTTLDARSIYPEENLALGSDSALTSQGGLLDEIRVAHRHDKVPAAAVYSMVTSSAASILRLGCGEGGIHAGAVADLIAVLWKDLSPCETLARADLQSIELVVLAGEPRLFSPTMAERWPLILRKSFEVITVAGTSRQVRAPVRQLLNEARACLSDGVRLAGKEVSV